MPEHYIPKEISKVDSKDSKLCLTGRVVSSNENSFILDDETGKIEIASSEKPGESKLIRAFCSVVDEKLSADVIQNVGGLDLDLLKKIKGLYDKAGV